MDLEFTKMQGLGNDFVVVDATRSPLALTSAQIRRIADRRFGVGCDQILVVEPPTRSDAEFFYRIFNADGGEVEQCGNGARCFARFVREKGLTDKTRIPVETRAGLIELIIESDDRVTVNMGVPVLEPTDIPFEANARAGRYALAVDGMTFEISAVSMGNPHAVLFVDDVDTAPVLELGPRIEVHPRFPNRTNVGFMQIVDRRQVRLRVWERGAGETLACGTGACAAVVAGRIADLLDESVQVRLPGGDLMISWRHDDAPVMMTGPAETVFKGKMTL